MTRLVLESPWMLWIGGPLAAVLLGLSVRGHWHAGRRGWRLAALVVPRALALILLVCLATRPTFVTEHHRAPPRDRVVLLIDRSRSMALKDVDGSRYGAVVRFAREQLVPTLERLKLPTEAMLFAEDAAAADGSAIATTRPDGRRTNLARAIARAVNTGDVPPLSVIALTDGASTEQRDNAQAATALVSSGSAFLGIGFGGPMPARQASLDEVTVPSTVDPRQEFAVTARLRLAGAGPAPSLRLLLLRDGRLVSQRDLSPPAPPAVWLENFSVQEEQAGVYRYTVQLVAADDPELALPNTEASASVRVTDDQALRVLFIQGGLTWDYKFIRLALRGDPQIKMTGLTRTASQSMFYQPVEEPGETPALTGFPSRLDQLVSFHVVMMANVKSTDLTPAQQELLARFCGELGGGLIMIGGPNTLNASWRNSRLEELLPVKLAPSYGGSTRSAVRWQLTDDARRHPLFRISDATSVDRLWGELPEFPRAAGVEAVKPGAWVWARARRGGLDGTPLMVAQRYGTGVSAIMSVQNFWRWRLAKSAAPEAFDRFWRQLARWLGEGGRATFELSFPDQRLEPGVELRAVIRRRPDPHGSGQPLRATLQITNEQDVVVTDIPVFLSAGESTQTSFTIDQPGLYSAVVLDEQRQVVDRHSLDLREIDRELVHSARDMESLRQWAELSGGVAMPVETCDGLEEIFRRLKQRQAVQQREPTREPVGVNGWMLALLLGCVGMEWVNRKRFGLS